jgi:hypothetical protein
MLELSELQKASSREFIMGATAGMATEFLFYGLDSYKVIGKGDVKARRAMAP